MADSEKIRYEFIPDGKELLEFISHAGKELENMAKMGASGGDKNALLDALEKVNKQVDQTIRGFEKLKKLSEDISRNLKISGGGGGFGGGLGAMFMQNPMLMGLLGGTALAGGLALYNNRTGAAHAFRNFAFGGPARDARTQSRFMGDWDAAAGGGGALGFARTVADRHAELPWYAQAGLAALGPLGIAGGQLIPRGRGAAQQRVDTAYETSQRLREAYHDAGGAVAGLSDQAIARKASSEIRKQGVFAFRGGRGVAGVGEALQGFQESATSDRDRRLEVKEMSVGTLELRAIGAAGGAAQAIMGGGGIASVARGAMGGGVFGPVGAGLAQKMGFTGRFAQQAGSAIAGFLGGPMFSDVISTGQQLLPMALQYGVGRATANIGGFGGMFSGPAARALGRLGFGRVARGERAGGLVAAAPGGMTPEGEILLGNMERSLSTPMESMLQGVSSMISQRGGGRIFSGEGVTGAGSARTELLKRILSDATSAGYERNMPEFTKAVTEGVMRGTEGLLLTAQQAAAIQDSVSANTGMMVESLHISADAAAKIAGGAQGAAGRMLGGFIGGGTTPGMINQQTARALRSMGITDPMAMTDYLYDASQRPASEMMATLAHRVLAPSFAPGVSPISALHEVRGFAGARMGLGETESYGLYRNLARASQARGGGLSLQDVQRELAMMPTSDAADPQRASQRLQEQTLQVMREHGGAFRAMASYQDRQLALAQQLARLAQSSLQMETGMMMALAKLARESGGTSWAATTMDDFNRLLRGDPNSSIFQTAIRRATEGLREAWTGSPIGGGAAAGAAAGTPAAPGDPQAGGANGQ